MSRKPKESKQAEKERTKKKFSGGLINHRDALGDYIEDPESFHPFPVVYYDDEFVAIHDRFPKSSLHLLLLPRDPSKTDLHPFDAFEDLDFLAKVQAEVKKLRSTAAAELRRKYGKYSAQEKAREGAMDADPPPDKLPEGRDWEKDIMCGIHAHPSMNHLHIHVMSVDRYSDSLKHRKHYNSFSTPFFIEVNDFPLAENDPRRHPGREGYLKRDYKCWRCGADFGNRFTKLKDHLEDEYQAWKRV
jgi:aprataxin